MKSAIAVIALSLALASPACAQSASIQQDLTSVLKQVEGLLTRGDEVVAQLKEAAKRGPAEAQRDLAGAAGVLGHLADRLSEQGDIVSQLQAIERAAEAHRDRVQALPKGTISEETRAAVLPKWNEVLQQAKSARAKIATVREKILGALTELRRRQIDLSEEILVGSYADAIKTLNQWLDDIQKLMEELRRSIGAAGV